MAVNTYTSPSVLWQQCTCWSIGRGWFIELSSVSGFSATFTISRIAFQWTTSFCSSRRFPGMSSLTPGTAGLFLLVSYTPVVSVWWRPTDPLTHEWLVHRPLLVLTMGCQREHFRDVFVFPIHNPSTKFLPVHINFYPSKWRVDGSLHKAMVWWHKEWKQVSLLPGLFEYVLAPPYLCRPLNRRVGFWSGHNRSQSDPQGTDVVIRSLQEVFEACNFPFLWMYPVIYICAIMSMKTL